MKNLGTMAAAHKARRLGVIAGSMLLALAYTAAHGQATPPAGNSLDNAPSEAARRAAMSPYRFILQHAATPRKPPAAPATPPTAAAAPEAKKAASPPVQQAAAQPSAAQTVRALEPAAPAVQPQPAAPPPPSVPDTAIAAISRQPTEPAPRLEIIPIRTEEPRLPPALIREQPKGTVKIAFDIQHDGTVRDVKVVSSTNRSLNRPTVEAVQNWKFEPVDAVLTVETEVVYKFD